MASAQARVLLLFVAASVTASVAQAGFFDRFKSRASKETIVEPKETLQFRAYADTSGAVVIQDGQRILYGAGTRFSEQSVLGFGFGGAESSYIAISGEPTLEGRISEIEISLSRDYRKPTDVKTDRRLDQETERALSASLARNETEVLKNNSRKPRMVYESVVEGKKWTLLIDQPSQRSSTPEANEFARTPEEFVGASNRQRVYIGVDGQFTPVAIEKVEAHFPYFESLIKANGEEIQLLKTKTTGANGLPNGVQRRASFPTLEGQRITADTVSKETLASYSNLAIDGFAKSRTDYRFVGQSLNASGNPVTCKAAF